MPRGRSTWFSMAPVKGARQTWQSAAGRRCVPGWVLTSRGGGRGRPCQGTTDISTRQEGKKEGSGLSGSPSTQVWSPFVPCAPSVLLTLSQSVWSLSPTQLPDKPLETGLDLKEQSTETKQRQVPPRPEPHAVMKVPLNTVVEHSRATGRDRLCLPCATPP